MALLKKNIWLLFLFVLLASCTLLIYLSFTR